MFPFCVNLKYFFQDNRYLYLVMPAVLGGELFRHLRKLGMLSENQAKFYAAQILLALEYLHHLDLVYRDLKPENILLDESGYVKMTDFGFCKHVMGRTYTLCGTPEYLAPEVILSKGYGRSVDWWSFGVLVYEMVAGFAPFAGKDALRIYEKVVKGKYKTPEGFSSDMRQLVRHTLQTDVSRRYGTNDSKNIKSLKWFKDTNWPSILNRQLTPPFVPKIKNQGDTSNFDRYDEASSDDENTDKYSCDDEFAEF
ncbi:hypothetical protein GE061_018186 [Apolygus lucorum]|uniref:Protein kinase domain-containing protein n=1 Tax=Apolygus lucorum TaxID=248454 RepID=A0A8S9XD17_APOLU|nr:hypothetical protein GE061_018186 [Apolygus lucorum]